MNIAFIDIETTGLDPSLHDVWEVGLIVGDHEKLDDATEHHWLIKPPLASADPGALRMNRFYDRTDMLTSKWAKANGAKGEWSDPVVVAHAIARLTAGSYLCGMNVDFDADFLELFLRKRGVTPAWQYKPVELESMMLGMLCEYNRTSEFAKELFPFKSSELSMFIGVNAGDYDRHTALGDARWAKDVFRKVTGL